MASPLAKAQKNPDSMKGKILTSARKIFGEYGYHGTTTRMIAQEVGIDISTLYYHWGEKGDLFEAVLMSIDGEMSSMLNEIERIVKGKSLEFRFSTAIEMICDYLFANPEVANLILFRYFSKTKVEEKFDVKVPEYISNIAVAAGLALDRDHVSVEVKAAVLAAWSSILNFISGENFFRPILNVAHDEYISVTKETLKDFLIPAFTQGNKIKGGVYGVES